MMRGTVNTNLEATLPLTMYGFQGQEREITAIIDTGYNGALTLPTAIVRTLSLFQLASRGVTLGDQSHKVLSTYSAEVLWDGQRRKIRVLCVEGDPLVGTTLLTGYRLITEFAVGGGVTLEVLP
jgi:clan AA aspartic protease